MSSLEQWKADVEYELKQMNKVLATVKQAIEELQTKKKIVDEVCQEVSQINYERTGYIFELQEDLQKKIHDKFLELRRLEDNPKKQQLEVLLEKITENINEEYPREQS
ncbi:hypothetical protein BTR23_03670 [Alkalihalophilus pseudofirmus]|nr:hypothetical protein BTR23_03670 [Alkalihalophilus pseudofirmus]